MKLGELLRQYMAANKISTRQLAVQIGVDHTTVHRIITGQSVRLDVLMHFLIWLLNPTKK
jgi:plasmid maintenance system antidote protein VapI